MHPQSCLGHCCQRRRPDRALSGNIVAVEAESCACLPRSAHGETQVLVLNGLHFATDRCNGRHYFAKLQLEENRGLSCGIKLDHQNPASVLPTKRSQIMVKAKPTATNTQHRASLCPVPPGREFSPELSASSIPSNVAARRCSPRSVVCQQNSRTRSRPRNAASAPAAATAATALQLQPAGFLCCLPRCTPFAELLLR